jgi:Uma2 family endonuclease
MVGPRPKIKFTYQDYKNAPEDKRYELLDGDLIVVPSPKEPHQWASIQLGSRLFRFVQESGLGRVYIAPFDVVLSDTDVVQPDILFVSNERMGIVTEDNIQGAPDLVIEILSPSTAERDRTFKRSLYARHGVREYWLVDPDARSVEVLVLGEGHFEIVATYGQDEELTSPMLEGLRLNLNEVF